MFYLVGGAVRDKLMGLKPKDLDYACEAPSYDAMKAEIAQMGGEIFLESPQFFTIRAKVPKLGVADFVLCRKEGQYRDGRHPDSVQVGNLHDDLARRDFTVNAMAEDREGRLIDPFGGLNDLRSGELHCVGIAYDRFNEDVLRLLRAIRFSITKQFTLSNDIKVCLRDKNLMHRLKDVSVERCRDELYKCFYHNTKLTMMYFCDFPLLLELFDGPLWLEPTLKASNN